MSEEVEAAKPVPKVYKGDVVEVGKYDGPFPVIVQVLDRDMTRNHDRLPLFLVITDIQPWGSGTKTVWFRNPRANFVYTSSHIENGVKLNVLTGAKGAAIAKEHAEWAKGNVGESAAKYGLNLGADPEIFAVDKDGQVIPAWKWLPSKEKAETVGIDSYYFPKGKATTYWDGFQAEFTVHSATCLAYLCDYFHTGLEALHNSVTKHAKGSKLSITSVLPVPADELAKADDKYVQFGCMPSKNIYNLDGRKADGRDVPFRFAGGHIHFGIYDKKYIQPRLNNIVKGLDAILGVSCVSLFASFDNPVRREFYGLPGEFRLPAHGLEYRTLSNAWLSHPLITNLVYELARRAFHYGWNLCTGWDATETETVDAILHHDVGLARTILERNRGALESLFKTTAPFARSSQTAVKLIMSGMESAIKDPEDIAGNWLLNGDWLNHCEAPGRNWLNAHATLEAGKRV
jgi:hypothetical protein